MFDTEFVGYLPEDVCQEIISTWEGSTGLLFIDLQEQMKSFNHQKVVWIVHALAGSCLQVGAVALGEFMRNLEQKCKLENVDQGKIESLVERGRALFLRTCEDLKKRNLLGLYLL